MRTPRIPDKKDKTEHVFEKQPLIKRTSTCQHFKSKDLFIKDSFTKDALFDDLPSEPSY